MSNSEMVQPTQGTWEILPGDGKAYQGMTRLVVSPTRKIQAVGTGAEVRRVIMAKMEERHGLSA